ncbi:MAG TPA: fumarylacetoacetate hydrolase family protein [Chloroflexota bacterium]|nr:fumarylacetoacetate hydrolase family protein [Chloroflexota bacterium]
MELTAERVEALARRLLDAYDRRTEIPALTDEQPELSEADGYRIQRALLELFRQRGARVVGKKTGLTSRAKQQAMGVPEAIYGYLLDTYLLHEPGPVRLAELIHPRLEPELAFILGERLQGPGVTTAQALAATRAVVPALEVIDSRYRDFKFRLADVVADNCSASRVVLGREVVPLAGLDLRLQGMVLEKNGEVVDTGAGAAVLGHPASAVAWLANKLAAVGEALEPGDIVLPGAPCEAVFVQAGDEIRVTFDRVGSVTARVV